MFLERCEASGARRSSAIFLAGGVRDSNIRRAPDRPLRREVLVSRRLLATLDRGDRLQARAPLARESLSASPGRRDAGEISRVQGAPARGGSHATAAVLDRHVRLLSESRERVAAGLGACLVLVLGGARPRGRCFADCCPGSRGSGWLSGWQCRGELRCCAARRRSGAQRCGTATVSMIAASTSTRMIAVSQPARSAAPIVRLRPTSQLP